MTLDWTERATADLARVQGFLSVHSETAATKLPLDLFRAAGRLRDFPRIGAPLAVFAPREARRLIVGRYELRYDIVDTTVRILRIWHEREHRAFEIE